MGDMVLANVTAVAIGTRAVLIEGPPGSGKSSLALALIDRGAVLIGDDAVTIEERDGVAWATPPPNTAGKIEIRNVGIVDLSTDAAPVALILSLDMAAPRFPLAITRRKIGKSRVPVLTFRGGDTAQAIRAEYALRMHGLPSPPTGAAQ